MYQRPVDAGCARFAGHIPVYPGMCNIRYRADAGATAPIFIAVADRTLEDWDDSAVCERYARELAASGQPVTYKEYPGTHHSSDGRGKFFYFQDSTTGKPCDMEVQMTDVIGGGLGRNARDFKTGHNLDTIPEWTAAVKACTTNVRPRATGNEAQSDALVGDVLNFIKVAQ